jgi:hypothetical protein
MICIKLRSIRSGRLQDEPCREPTNRASSDPVLCVAHDASSGKAQARACGKTRAFVKKAAMDAS